MENQLKPPTQPKRVSEADMLRIDGFRKLITHEVNPVDLRKGLTQLYFNYTGFLVKKPDDIAHTATDELYYLTLLIEILE